MSVRKIIKLKNVEQYTHINKENYPVTIQLLNNETIILRAFNESGYCWTDIDLEDLLVALEKKRIITINKNYKKKLKSKM